MRYKGKIMAREFNNKQRRTGMESGLRGTGSFDVSIDFLPDFITARYATQGTQGRQHDGKAGAGDSVAWELTRVSDVEYTFTVYYTCEHVRDIQWIVAKLPKNAEIISH